MFCFCFFKQKTAYEMRISDWSSDVCSSDLPKFTGKGGARYDFETSGLGTISPWVQFSYRTATHNSVARTLLNRIDGYMLIDAGLTWMAPGQKVSVDFLVQNATDKIYDLNPNPILGLYSNRLGEPRRYSVRLTGRW